jgi:Flp pilus assembly protein protease CpaA
MTVDSGTLLGKMALSAVLITIAAVDWRTKRVPHWLSWSTLAAGVAYRSVQGSWMLAPMAMGIVLVDLAPKRWRLAAGLGVIVAGTIGGLALEQEGIAQISVWWAVAYVMWHLNLVGGADVRLFWAMIALFPNATMALALGLGLFVWLLVWVLVIHRGRTLAALEGAGLRLKLGAFPEKEKLAAEGRATAPGLVLGALAYVWLLV